MTQKMNRERFRPILKDDYQDGRARRRKRKKPPKPKPRRRRSTRR